MGGGGGRERETERGYRQRKTKRAPLFLTSLQHTASTLIMDRRSLIVWAAMVLQAVEYGSFKPSSAASTVDIVLAK